MKYPKDKLTKCEEIPNKGGMLYYDLTLFGHTDNFPDGVSIDYEEHGTNILNNIMNNTWTINTKLPKSIQSCLDAGKK